jgi:isopentenyl-diphosphate delta-isomerase
MTGGTEDAKSINMGLAEAAKALNIPVGVGSQRQALENDDYIESYRIFKTAAQNIPVLSNIGAAQVAKLNSTEAINRIIDLVGASALVVHCNPVQELIQREGEADFRGLLNSIEVITSHLSLPVIVKEVGSGISKSAARQLLDVGVTGIDVAGAGGTSWGAVELVRNNVHDEKYFWNWGLPTSYCVRTVAELKEGYNFMLIASGGITNFDEIAKSIVLGADLTASAATILKKLNSSGVEGVIEFIVKQFEEIKKIMYLTGSSNLQELQKRKLLKKKDLY